MHALQGQILGDPDFDLLRITGGYAFLMPSPGHTTLTQVGSLWAVDSLTALEQLAACQRNRMSFVRTTSFPDLRTRR